MKTFQAIYLRQFSVRIRDNRTGEKSEDTIVLSKDVLRAAQIVGQSSTELIVRAYSKEGFTVLDVGPARKAEAVLDLEGLFELNRPEQEGGSGKIKSVLNP